MNELLARLKSMSDLDKARHILRVMAGLLEIALGLIVIGVHVPSGVIAVIAHDRISPDVFGFLMVVCGLNLLGRGRVDLLQFSLWLMPWVLYVGFAIQGWMQGSIPPQSGLIYTVFSLVLVVGYWGVSGGLYDTNNHHPG